MEGRKALHIRSGGDEEGDMRERILLRRRGGGDEYTEEDKMRPMRIRTLGRGEGEGGRRLKVVKSITLDRRWKRRDKRRGKSLTCG